MASETPDRASLDGRPRVGHYGSSGQICRVGILNGMTNSPWQHTQIAETPGAAINRSSRSINREQIASGNAGENARHHEQNEETA
ncbi:MAG: hypothetical protein ACR2OU_19565 [Thermomicrobiales bacterium]